MPKVGLFECLRLDTLTSDILNTFSGSLIPRSVVPYPHSCMGRRQLAGKQVFEQSEPKFYDLQLFGKFGRAGGC